MDEDISLDTLLDSPEELAAKAQAAEAEAAKAAQEAEAAKQRQNAYEGTQRALAEAEAAKNKPAPQAAQVFEDASSEAIAAMDLREELYDEIREILDDAPSEIRDELRKSMRQFKSYEQLQVVKANGIHKTLAEAAIGRAVRGDKYVPKNVDAKYKSVDALLREPVHSEPVVKIPDSYRREQQEVCQQLGVTLTEKELRQAFEDDRAARRIG